MTAPLNPPDPLPPSDQLAQLPRLPRHEGGPIFAEPWQATAFALAVRLSAEGRFTWKEWAEVLAIGDSWNDLPMLRAAGLSACPANAVPEVKAIVDYVSPLTATRGVADILRWAAAYPHVPVS